MSDDRRERMAFAPDKFAVSLSLSGQLLAEISERLSQCMKQSLPTLASRRTKICTSFLLTMY